MWWVEGDYMSELPTRERIILAIDASKTEDAERLAGVAEQAGARFVKLGLELQTATSWDYCADLAGRHGLDWVADAKLDDIPNTVAGAVKNIASKEHAPFGITIHTKAGIEAMRLSQEEAGDILMLGVTELTSIPAEETEARYGLTRPELVTVLARDAAIAGLRGVVASPKEVGGIKSDPLTSELFAMIPGTRSAGADSHDQANVGTPTAAIRDGADLLVIGRQISQAEDPAQAYENLVVELEGAV